MATFQKSNWTPSAGAEHARVYAPNALAAGNITGNGGQTTVTVTVPWQFRGNNQLEASLPITTTALNTGITLGQAVLLAPTGTSYATPGGSTSHPRAQVAFINSTNANLNLQQATDIIFVQY